MVSGDLVCWPAYPFRPDRVQNVSQPFLQTHQRGVPFSLLDRKGRRVWWIIPSEDQIARLRRALPHADMCNPPWSEIYMHLAHRGISAVQIEQLVVPKVVDLLDSAQASDA